jgi:hypothetical protein
MRGGKAMENLNITDWSILPQSKFESMQFDSGVITTGFDLESTMIDPDTILCATTGDITIASTPTIVDLGEDVNNLHGVLAELQYISGYDNSIKFTTLTMNVEMLKLALAAADFDSTTGAVKPRMNLKSTDFKTLWWIGALVGGGLVAVKLENVLNTAGLSLGATKDGKGKIELTGSLGDVMKESAHIAVSLARSLADRYGIEPDFYEKKDLHIHAPEGAVPKDGPSAGVTMITTLISALSGIPVRGDVAMTGEITLRGKVLAIGGLREKTMAAYKAGVKTVIVPKDNKGDLDEIDDAVKLGLEFVFAETVEDVLNTALVKQDKRHADIPFRPVKKTVRGSKKASV